MINVTTMTNVCVLSVAFFIEIIGVKIKIGRLGGLKRNPNWIYEYTSMICKLGHRFPVLFVNVVQILKVQNVQFAILTTFANKGTDR